jgi:UDP-N-acetylmuramoyl-L-alanyl-D-glutamate--2,6-diaminopimelate ligase
MEVTSHALELHRVRGIRFSAAVFTNLSQDHLDFHPTMEAYFRAKARLFTPDYSARAIVNGDDPRGALLAVSAQIPTESVTMADAADLALDAMGSSFSIGGHPVRLGMAGAFNVMNALEAAAAARTLGIDDAVIARGLATAAVPGRFERVDAGQPFAVVVDFAHTPDGLERLLRAARDTMPDGARLLCVFGCGGDRDRTKRPLMGALGADLSDLAIVTSDNPRSEDPAAIADEMLAGVAEGARNKVVVELDRRSAIERAIGAARPGDVVVIAGKGHEQGQDVQGVVTPFDDREVARVALRAARPDTAAS